MELARGCREENDDCHDTSDVELDIREFAAQAKTAARAAATRKYQSSSRERRFTNHTRRQHGVLEFLSQYTRSPAALLGSGDAHRHPPFVASESVTPHSLSATAQRLQRRNESATYHEVERLPRLYTASETIRAMTSDVLLAERIARKRARIRLIEVLGADLGRSSDTIGTAHLPRPMRLHRAQAILQSASTGPGSYNVLRQAEELVSTRGMFGFKTNLCFGPEKQLSRPLTRPRRSKSEPPQLQRLEPVERRVRPTRAKKQIVVQQALAAPPKCSEVLLADLAAATANTHCANATTGASKTCATESSASNGASTQHEFAAERKSGGIDLWEVKGGGVCLHGDGYLRSHWAECSRRAGAGYSDDVSVDDDSSFWDSGSEDGESEEAEADELTTCSGGDAKLLVDLEVQSPSPSARFDTGSVHSVHGDTTEGGETAVHLPLGPGPEAAITSTLSARIADLLTQQLVQNASSIVDVGHPSVEADSAVRRWARKQATYMKALAALRVDRRLSAAHTAHETALLKRLVSKVVMRIPDVHPRKTRPKAAAGRRPRPRRASLDSQLTALRKSNNRLSRLKQLAAQASEPGHESAPLEALAPASVVTHAIDESVTQDRSSAAWRAPGRQVTSWAREKAAEGAAPSADARPYYATQLHRSYVSTQTEMQALSARRAAIRSRWSRWSASVRAASESPRPHHTRLAPQPILSELYNDTLPPIVVLRSGVPMAKDVGRAVRRVKRRPRSAGSLAGAYTGVAVEVEEESFMAAPAKSNAPGPGQYPGSLNDASIRARSHTRSVNFERMSSRPEVPSEDESQVQLLLDVASGLAAVNRRVPAAAFSKNERFVEDSDTSGSQPQLLLHPDTGLRYLRKHGYASAAREYSKEAESDYEDSDSKGEEGPHLWLSADPGAGMRARAGRGAHVQYRTQVGREEVEGGGALDAPVLLLNPSDAYTRPRRDVATFSKQLDRGLGELPQPAEVEFAAQLLHLERQSLYRQALDVGTRSRVSAITTGGLENAPFGTSNSDSAVADDLPSQVRNADILAHPPPPHLQVRIPVASILGIPDLARMTGRRVPQSSDATLQAEMEAAVFDFGL